MRSILYSPPSRYQDQTSQTRAGGSVVDTESKVVEVRPSGTSLGGRVVVVTHPGSKVVEDTRVVDETIPSDKVVEDTGR